MNDKLNASVIRRLILLALVGALAVSTFRASSYRSRLGSSLPDTKPDARLGREVYIAEGCIHCHTQYVRPGTRDEILWGPIAEAGRILSEQPPLIGNRRQGPDLMNIGNRRSPEWNRAHLINPRSLVPGSRMPPYAHLFAPGDARGAALLAYLGSLGADTADRRALQIRQWQPAPDAQKIDSAAATTLYTASCAQCHGERGMGDGALSGTLGGASKGRLAMVPGDTPASELAHMIKFGIPGTSMPGYETLTDAEILGLAEHVKTLCNGGSKP